MYQVSFFFKFSYIMLVRIMKNIESIFRYKCIFYYLAFSNHISGASEAEYNFFNIVHK